LLMMPCKFLFLQSKVLNKESITVILFWNRPNGHKAGVMSITTLLLIQDWHQILLLWLLEMPIICNYIIFLLNLLVFSRFLLKYQMIMLIIQIKFMKSNKLISNLMSYLKFLSLM
jgi:hypothetical protein